MFKRAILGAGILGLAFFGCRVAAVAEKLAPENQQSVEVVFCLDTTSSMGGLIEGAKQKIWSIANQIVKGKPTPKLRVGLVAYRDKGDEYVTKVFPLDDDLDTVFKNLTSLQASGGGDSPEHVNKALSDSVREIGWSKNPETLKVIFLVGDCPPHVDYRDGYDYKVICQEAVKKDIIINTVQCGNAPGTEKFWTEIARLSEGKYAKIPQTGGVAEIETPMDAEFAKLNSALEETIVPFGSPEVMAKVANRVEFVSLMAPTIAAERAVYKSAEARLSAYDLIDAIKSKTVKLENVKTEELPDQMRKMSLEEKQDYLAKKEAQRQELKARIEKLNKERDAYIFRKLSETSRKDAFDEAVQNIIKEEAGKKGISY